MPSAHDVSTRLGSMGHDELEYLLSARSWGLGRQHDLHDVADLFLSPDSISATLRSMSRVDLRSLEEGAASALAIGLLLADAAGIPYPEVRALLPVVTSTDFPAMVTDNEDRVSVAVHTVIALRDLVEWVYAEPLPMAAAGGLLRAEERALAAGLVVPEENVSTIVHIAESAGLVRTLDRRLVATTAGLAARDDVKVIWDQAVAATLGELSPSIRAASNEVGRLDRAFLEWVAPARSEAETELLHRVADAAELLGVSGNRTRPALPTLESKVYILEDLSIIGAGPLVGELSEFLDDVSKIESRGLAPKRRFDPALVLRTVSRGTNVDAIIERLAALSITPLSTAVTSTIADIAANTRFVTLNGTGTDTAAKASHKELGGMLLSDPRLQRLAPVKVDDFAVLYGASRVRVETTLVENRYTVITPAVERFAIDGGQQSRIAELADSLFEVGLGSTHLERALVTAGKSRSRVTLLVETAQGTKTITFEPRHVGNGRVRGLDTTADVERTLPISAIIELIAVGD